MRPILVFLFTLLVGFVSAQSKPRSVTVDEEMYADKLNGTLVAWTKAQKDSFVMDCDSNIAAFFQNSRSFCKCAMKNMVTGINYQRYSRATDYQKGRMLSMHGQLNCKAIRRKE